MKEQDVVIGTNKPSDSIVARAAKLDYHEALDRVMGLADFERSTHSPGHSSFHLERMELLLERLGGPHLGTPTVHIAGTKGKGSTAAMVSSILTAAGLKVGLYTSPHLHSVVERVRVGPKNIDPGEFAALVDRAWREVKWVGRHGDYGDPSTFDLLTALAFLHFKSICADFQVIEVGLGGRLDATNVVRPEVCGITRISLDHVATLGDTVEKIAAEKAGILKDGVPAVIAPQSEEAMGVIRQVASEKGAPLVEVSSEMSWRKENASPDGQSFTVKGLTASYPLWMPLTGDHQMENAATAIAIVERLFAISSKLHARDVVEGLRSVSWPGRFQSLTYRNRRLIVDGAHNPDSIARLVRTVQEHFNNGRVILVFGGLTGHSARGMLKELAVLRPRVIAVRSRHPRSAASEDVAEVAREQGLPVLETSEHIGSATRRAVEIAGEADLVLGTGSLSVVAEMIEEVEGIVGEVYPNLRPPPAKARVG